MTADRLDRGSVYLSDIRLAARQAAQPYILNLNLVSTTAVAGRRYSSTKFSTKFSSYCGCRCWLHAMAAAAGSIHHAKTFSKTTKRPQNLSLCWEPTPCKIIRPQGQFQILDLERMAQEPKKRRSYNSLCRITTVLTNDQTIGLPQDGQYDGNSDHSKFCPLVLVN